MTKIEQKMLVNNKVSVLFYCLFYLLFCTYLLYFMYVDAFLYIYIHMCSLCMPASCKVQRGHQFFWNWSFAWHLFSCECFVLNTGEKQMNHLSNFRSYFSTNFDATGTGFKENWNWMRDVWKLYYFWNFSINLKQIIVKKYILKRNVLRILV